MENYYERSYRLFDNLIDRNYRHLNSVDTITNVMKLIFKEQSLYKYIFEQYYSDNRSPFITAYYQTMDYLQNGFDFDKTIQIVAKNILKRIFKEKRSGDIYLIY